MWTLVCAALKEQQQTELQADRGLSRQVRDEGKERSNAAGLLLCRGNDGSLWIYRQTGRGGRFSIFTVLWAGTGSRPSPSSARTKTSCSDSKNVFRGRQTHNIKPRVSVSHEYKLWLLRRGQRRTNRAEICAQLNIIRTSGDWWREKDRGAPELWLHNTWKSAPTRILLHDPFSRGFLLHKCSTAVPVSVY